MGFGGERGDAGDAFGGEAPPHASDAFAQSPARRIGSGSKLWLRVFRTALVLLLLFVALPIAGHIEHRGASAQGPSAAGWCVPGSLPKLATVTPHELLELRAIDEKVLARDVGRQYAWGPVQAKDAWRDNPPEHNSVRRSDAGAVPGSFEIRQWAPDPRWGAAHRDNVAVDAFRFAESAQARLFFETAASADCHGRRGVAAPARFPSGSRELVWVNPDGYTQQDLFLLGGRVVYRLVDVRPQEPPTPPSRAEDAVGLLTVESLGCSLPGARCPRTLAAPENVPQFNVSVTAESVPLFRHRDPGALLGQPSRALIDDSA